MDMAEASSSQAFGMLPTRLASSLEPVAHPLAAVPQQPTHHKVPQTNFKPMDEQQAALLAVLSGVGMLALPALCDHLQKRYYGLEASGLGLGDRFATMEHYFSDKFTDMDKRIAHALGHQKQLTASTRGVCTKQMLEQPHNPRAYSRQGWRPI